MKVTKIILIGSLFSGSLFANNLSGLNGINYQDLKHKLVNLGKEIGKKEKKDIKKPKEVFIIEKKNIENYNVYVENNEIKFFYSQTSNKLNNIIDILKKFSKLKNNKECNIKYKILNDNNINKVIIKGKCKYNEKNYKDIESLFRHDTEEIEKMVQKEEKEINKFMKTFKTLTNKFFGEPYPEVEKDNDDDIDFRKSYIGIGHLH